MRTPLLLTLLLTASLAVQAQTYRWVDASGRTIISDTPPIGSGKKVNKTIDAAPQEDNLPYATKRAMEAFPVVLYTSADCGDPCKQARDLLSNRGIPFTDKTLQKPEDAAELKQLVGEVFVPSLKVGNQRQRGFEAGAYHNLLDLAGYPKTAPYGVKKADEKK